MWTHQIRADELRCIAKNIDNLVIKQGYVIAAYSVEAEARYLHAIGCDVARYQFIDLWVEYQMLLNNNDEIAWGSQLIKGKVRSTRKPLRKAHFGELQEESEEDRGYHAQAENGLAACTYKLLGKVRDTEHKKEMRKLIIGGGPFSEDDRTAILDYCSEDTLDLPEIFNSITTHYQKKLSPEHFSTIWEEMLGRGQYALRSAFMVMTGYPADVAAARNLSANIPHLKIELARDVNRIIRPVYGITPYKWNKKEQRFSKDLAAIESAIIHDYPRWPRSEKTGRVSMDEDTLKKYTSARHSFKPTIVDQLVRIQRTESALRGFEPSVKEDKKSFFDYIGSDGRVRPFFGIFRSQSSRTQPQAAGFLFLKSAWIRRLVQSHPDCYIGAIDYGAQEFLIAAVMSGDRGMLEDYLSGDPYLAFGRRANIVPPTATKSTHKIEREVCKSLILGTSYGLGAKNMANKITYDCGVACSEEEARQYLYLFRQAYPDYVEWRKSILVDYQRHGYLRLCDGWTMWGDNDNDLSTQNCPVQGTGAVVMRRAVTLSQDRGVIVIKTLHDALYNEGRISQPYADVDLMCQCMQEAWHDVCKKIGCRNPPNIRMEAFIWGPNVPSAKGVLGDGVTPYESDCEYVDDRAKVEYELYKQYLQPPLDTDFDW